MQPETDNVVRAAADKARRGEASTRETARDQLTNIMADERQLIADANAARQADMGERWLGLALSGGGIRSASFALGVLQALHNWELFRRIDYLSTVSGGGYIGSALTYFLQAKKMGEKNQFPFGRRAHSGARAVPVAPPLQPGETVTPEDEDAKAPPPDPDAIISYLRLHAHYLTPAPDLSWPAFIGSAIRAAFTALAVYFPLLLACTTLLAWSEYTSAKLGPVKDLLGSLSCWGSALVVSELSTSFCGVGGTEVDRVIFFNWPLLGLLLVLVLSVLNAFAFVLQTNSAIKSDERRKGVYPAATIDNAKRNGRMLIAFVVFVFLALLPWLAHLLNAGLHTVLTASISTLVGYLGTLWDFRSRLKGATGPGSLLTTIRPIVFAALTAYGLLVLAMSWSEAIVAWNGPTTDGLVGLVACGAFIGFSLLINAFSNLNLISQHRMYRDRLMEAFCPSDRALARMSWRPSVFADTLKLSDCAPKPGPLPGPYHLINTALVAPDSKSTLYRSRSGDNFVLSPLACGSDATGWVPTAQFLNNMMTLPTAMAISGAALNAHSGAGESAPTRNAILSFLLTLFGAQLGYWAPHPLAEERVQRRQPKFLNPGLHSLLGLGLDADKSRGFVQLADGGHFENLALYELIRRRTDVIICSDAAQDQEYGFEDLGIAVERLRVDYGTNIEFRFPGHGPANLIPGSRSPADLWTERYSLAKRGFAIAEIIYPPSDAEPAGKSGYLLYLKATLIEGLPSDLYAYKKLNPDYPNQTTVDQDFDEYQFEAYRELGYRLATECFLELFPAGKDQDITVTMKMLWTTLAQLSQPPAPPAPTPDEPRET